MSHIGVLLIEDHPAFRAGILRLLASTRDIQVIGSAEDGEAAMARARQDHPDVAVIDVNIPSPDGLEVTRQILAEVPLTKVVIQSADDSDEMRKAARKAGAIGFVSKARLVADLPRAIRMAAEGLSYFPAGRTAWVRG